VMIHFDINLLSTPGSPKLSLSLMFPLQKFYTPLISAINATCPIMTFVSTGSPEQYWVSGTVHKAPHCVVFSSSL
jgi:hypothetical protein